MRQARVLTPRVIMGKASRAKANRKYSRKGWLKTGKPGHEDHLAVMAALMSEPDRVNKSAKESVCTTSQLSLAWLT